MIYSESRPAAYFRAIGFASVKRNPLVSLWNWTFVSPQRENAIFTGSRCYFLLWPAASVSACISFPLFNIRPAEEELCPAWMGVVVLKKKKKKQQQQRFRTESPRNTHIPLDLELIYYSIRSESYIRMFASPIFLFVTGWPHKMQCGWSVTYVFTKSTLCAWISCEGHIAHITSSTTRGNRCWRRLTALAVISCWQDYYSWVVHWGSTGGLWIYYSSY